MRGKFGDAPRIQLNDSFRTAAEIGEFIAAEKDKLNELERAKMTVSIKADEATRMGIITDIKQELRKAQALKISYISQRVLSY
jgi:biopolymer transport protein ExbD